jgi:hypothetical protein
VRQLAARDVPVALLSAAQVAALQSAFPAASLNARQVETLREAYAALSGVPALAAEQAGLEALLARHPHFLRLRCPATATRTPAAATLGLTTTQAALLLRGGRDEALERLRVALTTARAISVARSAELAGFEADLRG